MPSFLSKNSPGARPGAAAVGWAGEPEPVTRESRTTHRTRSWQACCGWFPSPWGYKGSSSSHGRDSGTFPLPPPLGLEGFAFHMAPGWGRWAQGKGMQLQSQRRARRARVPQNPTSQRAGSSSSTSAGSWLKRRRLGEEGHLLTHISPCLPPSPLALPVGGRGRGARRVIPGALEGGGEDISYPRY